MRAVVKLVDEKGEMGAVNGDIKELELKGNMGLEAVLAEILERYLVVRVGVVSARFVTHKHAKSWLLHSFKLNRVRDTERMESVKYSGKLYQGNGPPTEIEEKKVEETETRLGT